MNKRQDPLTGETDIENMLKQSLPDKPVLPADFEDRVMVAIRAANQGKSKTRRATLIMMSYWGGAALFSSAVLFNALAAGSVAGLAVLLSTLGAIGVLQLFLARQSQVRLSELFMKTFIRA